MLLRKFWWDLLRSTNVHFTVSGLFLFGLLMLAFLPLAAQEVTSYQPLQSEVVKLREAKSHLTSSHNDTIKRIRDKEVKEFYLERHEYILNNIKEDNYLFDASIYAYVQDTWQKVLKGNPEFVNTPLRVFVERTSVANAACYGEGTLVVNLGLLSRLANQDQLAFVLCHELAHYSLDHVNGAFMNRLNYLRSKGFKEKVKTIKKSKYNKYDQLEDLIKDFTYVNRRHSRAHESSADSLGLIYLRNTSFDPQEALTLLGVLDRSDEEKYTEKIRFDEHFSFEAMEFDPYWLYEATGLGVKQAVDSALIDSLKTHPDCDLRIAGLQQLYGLTFPESDSIGDLKFKGVALVSDFEIIQASLESKNLSTCLYFTLHMLQAYPRNIYLHAVLGICLHEIYRAQENHELGKYVRQPRDNDSKNMKNTLLLINNWRLKEIKKLFILQVEQANSAFPDDEHLHYTRFLLARLQQKNVEVTSLREQYKKKYPKGIYLSKMTIK